MNLYGRDLLCTHHWSLEELMTALELAARMKRNRYSERWTSIMKQRTLALFFYSPSLIARQSIEAAVADLGGHAQFLTPATDHFETGAWARDQVADIARATSRYAAGIGVRILADQVPYYGAGYQLLQEYARWAAVPVVTIGDDRFDPFQGLADVMTWAERYGAGPGRPDYAALRGKKLLLSWGSGAAAHPWGAAHEALLIASRFGMQITMAYPEGYDLDPEVIAWARENCAANNTSFEITHDPDSGYAGAHVVYPYNWISPIAYRNGLFHKQAEVEQARAHPDWRATPERMARTDHAILTYPAPVGQGQEIATEVVASPCSVIYDVVENRLHVQKAVIALTMGDA